MSKREPAVRAFIRLTATVVYRLGVMTLIACSAVQFTAAQTSSNGPVITTILGDSLSAGSGGFGQLPNWHTQLANTGQLSTGSGAYNFAGNGDTSSDVVSPQSSAAANLVAQGLVDYAAIVIGGNDAADAGQTAVSAGSVSAAAAFPSTYANNVQNSVAQLKSAGDINIVLANIPDITVTPRVQLLNAPPFLLSQFRSLIESANSQLQSYAASQGIPVIDLYSFSQQVLDNTPFQLGGNHIGVDAKVFNGTSLFTPDGFHADPAAHGLYANMFVEAVNRTYGAGLNPLSDQRVLLNSGDLGSLPTTETFFDINDLVIRDQLTRTWAGGTGSLTDDSQWVEGARPYLPDVAVFDQVGSHELIVNGAESVAVGQFVSGDVNIGTHVLVGTTSTPGGSSLRFADQLSLEGGSLKVNQLHVAPDGTFNFDVGKLTIDGGIFDHSSQHLKFGLGSRDLSLLNGAEAHLQSMSFGNFNTLGTNSFRIEGGTTTVDASVVVDGVTMTVADADLQFGDTLRIGSTQSIFGNPIPFAGTFVHNGGTTAGDIVSIGDTSTGDYTISAGTLDVNSIVAGNNTESATFDGVGTFTQTGGNVVVTDAITLGAHADSQGTYQLDGGTLTAGSINISPDSSFNFTGGALRTVQFVGDLAQDGGLITIGNSPGVMDIDGNYLMNAGTLEIELGGYLAGTEFDFLDVSGTAMLDGQLDVLFIDGFLPGQIGDSFAILEADGGITLGSGFVASLPDLSHLGPHSAWQVNVSGNSLALSVVPEPSSMAFAGMAGCFGVAVATRRRRNSCQTSA